MAAEQKITPFEVSGGVDEHGQVKQIDYNKLIKDFGATPIDDALLERFEKVTGHRPHRFMRRNIVISHRELDVILTRYEKGERFYLYTGRGPSSDSMHVGHSVPFEFTRWLQEVFDCPLVIQLTDDEKFMHNEEMEEEDVERYTIQNAKDIIAVGFDPKKTFIFSDWGFVGGAFYKNVTKAARKITFNQIRGAFGFDAETNNIGEFHFPAIQSAPAFATSFPHIFGKHKRATPRVPVLIPCAIDQDPYFRVCRHIAQPMKYEKPSLIHSRFLPALQGEGTKMSASVDASAIFLTDPPNAIKKKINQFAFSGGQETTEKQRELGGRTDVDVPYKYLTFFLEDDAELEKIRQDYESGELMTGEIKALCIKHLQEYVAAFQERRAKVTDDVVADFFAQKPLLFKGQLANELTKSEEDAMKILEKQEQEAADLLAAQKRKKEEKIAAKKAAKDKMNAGKKENGTAEIPVR
jgi:tryptophanyl-tRNA synthetase